jgi:hypothetical protein
VGVLQRSASAGEPSFAAALPSATVHWSAPDRAITLLHGDSLEPHERTGTRTWGIDQQVVYLELTRTGLLDEQPAWARKARLRLG